MASSRETIEIGRLGSVERVENAGDVVFFVRCNDRLLSRHFASEALAVAYLQDVDAGKARPEGPG